MSSVLEFKPYEGNRPRLLAAQTRLYYVNPRLSELVDLYRKWRDYDEYLVFRVTDTQKDQVSYKMVKGAKRGNDVYAWRLRKKLGRYQVRDPVEFFNDKNRSKRHKTKALFVTLTYKQGGLLGEAWECIGEDWNRWITGLRNRYGEVQYVRVWEAHKSGYPHIHALLLFDQDFEVFYHKGKWRVQSKDDIMRAWSHGYTDLIGLKGMNCALNYITKYITKSGQGKGSADLTNAVLWVYRKQAYSISGRLIDLINLMRNSNSEGSGWMDLHGDLHEFYVYELVGMWAGVIKGASEWTIFISRSVYFELRFDKTWSQFI